MKKALIAIATIILAVIMAISCIATTPEDSSVDNEYIIETYKNNIAQNLYYNCGEYLYVTIIDGTECYTTADGDFYYGDKFICSNMDFTAIVNTAEIFEKYKANIAQHAYYHSGDYMYVTVIDGAECYTTVDGEFYYNGDLVFHNAATADKDMVGTVIFQHGIIAVTYDSDFIYIYYLGEIVDILNIHTGTPPKG